MTTTKPNCLWGVLPNPELTQDQCKHPWRYGVRCNYIGREDECPTKQHGLTEEEESDELRPEEHTC
jgi:hypothetical protein